MVLFWLIHDDFAFRDRKMGVKTMEESTVELRESTMYTWLNKLEQQREKTWGVNRMKNTNSRPPQDGVVFRPIRKLQCTSNSHPK